MADRKFPNPPSNLAQFFVPYGTKIRICRRTALKLDLAGGHKAASKPLECRGLAVSLHGACRGKCFSFLQRSSFSPPVTASETLPLSNEKLSEAFLPMVPDTAFVAYFGHIVGYGANYYGYAWADAIAADWRRCSKIRPTVTSTSKPA
jgi:hypothetical protein